MKQFLICVLVLFGYMQITLYAQDSVVAELEELSLEIPEMLFDNQMNHVVQDSMLKVEQERSRDAKSQTWILIAIILPLFSIYTYLNKRFLKENLQVAFNFRLSDQIQRERELASTFHAQALMLLFILELGVIAYSLLQPIDWFPFVNSELLTILIIAVAFLVLFIARSAVYAFFLLLFPFNNYVDHFRFVAHVYYQLAGYAVFPVLVVYKLGVEPSNEVALIIILGLLSTLVLLRLIALIRVVISIPLFRVSYFLLYFCAFEIAPALVIYRLIDAQGSVTF